MSVLVQPRLINDPAGDPGLYLDFHFGRRAILFDLGDTAPLSARELLRVSHVFVSHAHMDHIAGLDRLLRLRLHRPRPLLLLGPAGFVDQMQNRLGSFTWNLLNEASVDFRLTVQSFDGETITEAAEFRAREQYRRRGLPPPDLPPGTVLREPEFDIRAAALDHGTPSLAFAFRQSRRFNVLRNRLDDLGLPVGPWIDTAKQAMRDGLPDDQVIVVPGAGQVTLAVLRDGAFQSARGQHFAYVADAADTGENRALIADLARGADHLFIESAFLDRDRDLATATRHLTARAAGEIARATGVRRVTLFHHSARYDDYSGFETEMRAAFDHA
ncbi:MBL fold metallo-hydrolase [Thalassovita aquimarina]|uniref:MBL fold metallo-hydrolase n=1 Tax=Thalassovita aquimarina TaxID=2785917 RepID=A0ABS5HRK5_9RHOB|nr:MBL fold metallo-hydrolase [Thalassovita aquimarina]MBR9651178.1 MBL fold metallo-hydrolase [Thalassovita aquimarina]